MDWNKCALCQTGSDNLLDPSENLNPSVCGYVILADKINDFVAAGIDLPNAISVSIETLRGSIDIEHNLKDNKAKWHKNCALELSSSRLKRAKLKQDKSVNEPTLKKTRTSFSSEDTLRKAVCFFCDEHGFFPSEDKPSGKSQSVLHKVTTMKRDKNIRLCATQMGDEKLLAKLSEGDMISREKSYHGKCMTKFNNMYRKFVNRKTHPEKDRRQDVENIFLKKIRHGTVH